MPIIKIEWAAGRSDEAKKKIAEGITDIMAENTGMSTDDMIVMFEDYPRKDIYIARKCIG
ncbi:MAG: tautomerase family protein [Dehalococcoidales bacterium]